ncbi:MAG: cytochrome c [Bacillota bacterium]|nr:cytochrome c [Bacillota bacterium]
MKKVLLGLAMGTSLMLAACGGGSNTGSNTGTKDTASSGEAANIFSQHCASCHGGNLEGGVGPKLADVGSRLTKAQIETRIKNGGGGMPPGLIQGAELTKVAEWLSAKK